MTSVVCCLSNVLQRYVVVLLSFLVGDRSQDVPWVASSFLFPTYEGTWLVELAWNTNSIEKTVQNSGTKSSHMSSGERRQNRDKQHLAVSCVPVWCKCTCFN